MVSGHLVQTHITESPCLDFCLNLGASRSRQKLKQMNKYIEGAMSEKSIKIIKKCIPYFVLRSNESKRDTGH